MVSANPPMPSPTHPKSTTSALGLEGNFVPKTPAPMEGPNMTKMTFLKSWAGNARTSFHIRPDEG